MIRKIIDERQIILFSICHDFYKVIKVNLHELETWRSISFLFEDETKHL